MLKQLRDEFLNPADEYTPFPFWFWNGDLQEDEIIRQIHDFKDKGIDGFVIHPRMGIPEHIGYLSDRFMELVKCAVNEAAESGMKVVLYDEGMYPSGSAHGRVVQSNPRYASRGLKMMEYGNLSSLELCSFQSALSTINLEEGDELVAIIALPKAEAGSSQDKLDFAWNQESCRILFPTGKQMEQQPGHHMEQQPIQPMGQQLRRTVEQLPEQHREIVDVQREIVDAASASGSDCNKQWAVYLFVETYTKGHIRGVHFGEDDGESGAPPSADLLNQDAINQFIQFTHERYWQALKECFGSTIIGMFTDEPAIMGRGGLRDLIPWTDGFLDWYLSKGGRLYDLPALFIDVTGAWEVKSLYQKAVRERLEFSYYRPISQWCEEHGIALMGHPEASDDIGILRHFHIPGQDVVWRWAAPENETALEGVHSTQAKCSSDAARHMGRRRNSNECFGCCGPNGIQWAFSMDDMKWYMDWLFVRGVNMLIPHAFFYSIEGEKRLGERPPDVGPNNLWWPYYRSVSKYIKRMSWLMTDSFNAARVAVLCEANHLPWEIAKPLYENQIEFNYLEERYMDESEADAENNAVIGNGYIRIRGQRYNVLLIEGKRNLEPALAENLQKFLNTGGKIILYHSDLPETALEGVQKIEKASDLVQILDSAMDRDACLHYPSDSVRLSHIVKEGVHFYLLVNEGENPVSSTLSIGLTGCVEQWDGWIGEVKQVLPEWKENRMELPFRLERRQSLIFAVDISVKSQNDKSLSYKAQKSKARDNNAEHSTEVDYEVLQTLEDGWSLYNGKEQLYRDFKLCSWTELPGMKDFSGTLTYMLPFMFDLTGMVGSKVYLDLGSVYNIVDITVNGRPIGVKMWRPYVFEITGCVQNGENKLEIKVTNTLANRISKAELASGLIGPVRIICTAG